MSRKAKALPVIPAETGMDAVLKKLSALERRDKDYRKELADLRVRLGEMENQLRDPRAQATVEGIPIIEVIFENYHPGLDCWAGEKIEKRIDHVLNSLRMEGQLSSCPELVHVYVVLRSDGMLDRIKQFQVRAWASRDSIQTAWRGPQAVNLQNDFRNAPATALIPVKLRNGFIEIPAEHIAASANHK